MLKRGFISRSASVVTLVGALALLSSISGVTAGTIDDSVGNAQQSPSSLVFSSASADGFSYSRWLENQGTVPASADSASTDESQADQGQAPITYGSFVLTETPLERIYGNVKDSWTQTFQNIITRAGDTSMLRGWAMDYVTGQEVDIQAGIDSWWDQRQADTTGIFVGMADVLTDNIFQAGEDQVGGFSFIRSLDWDYQTELGGRPWQLGVNAIGSLREADDDVMLWQLRGFTAKDSKGGANAGLIYRWAQEDTAMFGVNTFLDFEAHDRGDFLRWSVGGEVRTEWIDLYGNRYMAITDPRLQTSGADAGKYAYTKDGLDLEAAFHVPDMRWVSGYVKYYLFEGQGGEADDKGFVYGVKVSPPMAENLRLELELDDQDGGDLDVGGRVSYRHEFGGVPSGTRTAGASSFDPRDYFFDAVRREYAQRIGLYGAGGDVASTNRNALGASMVFSSLEGTVVVMVTVDYKNPSHTFSTADPITIVVLEADDGKELDNGMTVKALIKDIAGIKGSSYDMSLSKDTHISYEEQGAVVSLTMGAIFIDRNGGSPESIGTPNMKVDLIGTELRIAYVPAAATETAITLYAGAISLTYADGASFEASVANDAQIHDGEVTYYACNTAERAADSNFIGVTSPTLCVLSAEITPDPTAGNVIAAVGLPKGDLVRFDVSKGVGAYNLELTSNPKNYFVVVQDDSDSSIFRISVGNVPESEDGLEYVIAWKLNDEFKGEDSGNITVQFTKAPSAENALRYVVAGQPYNETINIPVVGGVPDDATGYTFELADGTDPEYTLGDSSGSTIILTVALTAPAEGVSFVTVSIQDSQDPPQSGTFVLEVRVVPELTFSDVMLTISQTESASFLSGVEGGNTEYPEANNERTYVVISDSPQFTTDNDGMVAVGAGAAVATTTVTVRAMDTVPPQTVTAELVIDVLFKATPVAFDSDNINLPESIDPDVDVPLSITLKATGGAQSPSYTFSITDGNETWLTIVSPDVLVIGDGAPGSGTHTFKVEVEDGNSGNTDGTEKDELEITFAFRRPQATLSDIVGEIIITGDDGAGTYSTGEVSFDPKTAGGVTVDVQSDGNSAVVVLANGDISVAIDYSASDGSNIQTGEWIFMSAQEVAQIVSTGTQLLGNVAIGFPDTSGEELKEAFNSPGMQAFIIGGSGKVSNISSSVKFVTCHGFSVFGSTTYNCVLRAPTTPGNFAASSQRQLATALTVSASEAWPEEYAGRQYVGHPFKILPKAEYRHYNDYAGSAVTYVESVDCDDAEDLPKCAGQLAIVTGFDATLIPEALLGVAEGSFIAYDGGSWVVFKGTPSNVVTTILPGINLAFEDDCEVTLPNSATCS